MQLKDVEKLTGLSSKAIRLYEDKGLISVERQVGNDYRIFLEGKAVTFVAPSVNHDLVKDDGYIELEEFDQALMKYSIQKESSLEFLEGNQLDQVYRNRFIRIIQNE